LIVMGLNLRPGEYIVWKGGGWFKGTVWRWVFIILGVVMLVTIIFSIIGIILIILALIGGEYVVTNMRAVALGRGEIPLNTPGLTVGLVPKRIDIGSWGLLAMYDVVFLMNGVEQMRFKSLTHDKAHEVVAKLASMGVKVVSQPIL